MTTITLRTLRTSRLLHESYGLLKQPLFQTSSNRLYTPFRHASSSSSTSNPSTSSSLASSKPLSKVNGPLSTLPAPLALPAQQPNQSYFPSYLYSLGKAYLTFYKTGVKNIYANYKLSRALQETLSKTHNSSLQSAIAAHALTRSDFQLLHRNKHDLKRVPMFGLVFLICGEFTPLVVLALSNVVPWTCRIPKQIDGDRRVLEERRSISFRNLTMQPPAEKGVQAWGRQQLIHVSWSLGLSSRLWDWLGGQYPGLPNGMLRRKVEGRVRYLEMDDRLIGECGGVKEMSGEEVKMACVERGINVMERSESDTRKVLGAWLRSAEKVPIERLLLTRPSVWPIQAAKKSE